MSQSYVEMPPEYYQGLQKALTELSGPMVPVMIRRGLLDRLVPKSAFWVWLINMIVLTSVVVLCFFI